MTTTHFKVIGHPTIYRRTEWIRSPGKPGYISGVSIDPRDKRIAYRLPWRDVVLLDLRHVERGAVVNREA